MDVPVSSPMRKRARKDAAATHNILRKAEADLFIRRHVNTFSAIREEGDTRVMEVAEQYNRRRLLQIINNFDAYMDDLNAFYETQPKALGREEILRDLKMYAGQPCVEDKSTGWAYCIIKYVQRPCGRWYTEKGVIGLQSISRPVRHTISAGISRDFDFENCQPSLILQFIKHQGWECAVLERYVNKRTEVLGEVMECMDVTRSAAKQMVISVINGGLLSMEGERVAFLRSLRREMVQVFGHLKESFPNIHVYAQDRVNDPDASTKSVEGAVMAFIYDHLESACLEYYMAELETRGLLHTIKRKASGIQRHWYVLSGIHDGMQIIDPPPVKRGTPPRDMEREMRNIARDMEDDMDYKACLVPKPFDCVLPTRVSKACAQEIPPPFEIPELSDDAKDLLRVVTHMYAARYIKRVVLKDEYVYCPVQMVWYRHVKGIWGLCNDPGMQRGPIFLGLEAIWKERQALMNRLKEVDESLVHMKPPPAWLETLTTQVVQAKNLELFAGSNNFLASVVKVLQLECAYKCDLGGPKTFAERLDSTNVIACNDQVHLLDTHEWVDIRPNHYVSKTTGFNRPTPNPEVQQEIRDFFRSIQHTQDDADYLLQVQARNICIGNPDQHMYVYHGLGGNGKTILFHMIRAALGDYYVLLDVVALTKAKRSPNDHDAMWQAIGSRFLGFEEPSGGDTLQESLVKPMTGDSEISSRPPYGRERITFRASFTPHMSCNDHPKIPKVSQSMVRRLNVIGFPFFFETKEKIKHGDPTQKVRDDTLEAFSRSTKCGEQMLLILLEEHRKLAGKSPKPTPFHKNQTKLYFEEMDTVISWVRENFEVTGDRADRIDADSLRQDFERNVHKITPHLLTKKLKSIGVFKGHSDGQFFFMGIAKRPEATEDVEQVTEVPATQTLHMEKVVERLQNQTNKLYASTTEQREWNGSRILSLLVQLNKHRLWTDMNRIKGVVESSYSQLNDGHGLGDMKDEVLKAYHNYMEEISKSLNAQM